MAENRRDAGNPGDRSREKGETPVEVYQDTLVVCVRSATNGAVQHDFAVFVTTTTGLCTLADWLHDRHVMHVAIRASGTYWKPVWRALEVHFRVILGTAAGIHNLPEPKADSDDATWITDVLAQGLIPGRLLPPTLRDEVRSLARAREQFNKQVAESARCVKKILEEANVRIADVINDITCVSGRSILRALIAGETDPEKLVALPQGRTRGKRSALLEACRERLSDYDRLLLKLNFDLLEGLRTTLAYIEARLKNLLQPVKAQLDLLVAMGGSRDVFADVLVADVGAKTAHYLIRHSGIRPKRPRTDSSTNICGNRASAPV